MIYYERGSPTTSISDVEFKDALEQIFAKLGDRKRVLAVPPDITRFHSRGGEMTRIAAGYYGDRLTDVLPALGTHAAMTSEEILRMFGNTPSGLFRVHDWRKGLKTLGYVPGSFVSEVSECKLDYDWPAQVSTLIAEGGHDLILSFGQVVPHEVVGMANYNKNIFVGTGGVEGINKSHFLGAVYGMERMMGRADTPVRRVLNYASDNFKLPAQVVYVMSVVGRDESGALCLRGLFAGDDYEIFKKAAALSLHVNFTMVEKPLKKVVVYLDPDEFRSTWLGNKSIYRTRMAIADGGELIVLAPAVKEFGEDSEIDRLIRKYGYRGTEQALADVDANPELAGNLSAAAHLIHGSSEGRFKITYCPGKLSKAEIESVNYCYGDLGKMIERYNPSKLHEGINKLDNGEEVYYISNPALGLWADRSRFTG